MKPPTIEHAEGEEVSAEQADQRGDLPAHDKVRYIIHPGIGIARVGNSVDEVNGWYVGPQVPGGLPLPPYKDETGAVKRQAALFHIYACDEAGRAIKEVTADDAEIKWRVHLANRKAAWYEFTNAMDLGPHAIPARLRNQSLTGTDREHLVIDPGERTVSGRNDGGQVFNTGTFMGKSVYLGELRTDDKGRLLVLGGKGDSAPADGHSPATTFANNDGWHDDVSDGPIRATVTIDGETCEAEPAVVVVAPPNFGQGLQSIVTMYDVVLDMSIKHLDCPPPQRVSFRQDIYPIFHRLVQCQWVNQGIYFLFGANSPSDLIDPDLVQVLSDPCPRAAEERQRLFHWFRDPDAAAAQPVALPPFYGDTYGDYSGLATNGLAVTPTQYGLLRRWADGDFDSDFPPPSPALPAADQSHALDQLPIGEQPHALDRAALEECLGGPFHPGIEMTWIMRRPSLWESSFRLKPFRLKVLPEDQEVMDDYGPTLLPDVCLGSSGPLQGSGPGTLTRWMGVPWQTDEASCLAGYDLSTYLPLPSFWAVRVPNDVLSEEAYNRAMDTGLPQAQRLKHFDHRHFWLRDLGPSYDERINGMIASWHHVGIVAPRDGPTDHAEAHLPPHMWVETGRATHFRTADPTWQQVQLAEQRSQPAAAEQALIAETAQVPVNRRRRHYRRDER